MNTLLTIILIGVFLIVAIWLAKLAFAIVVWAVIGIVALIVAIVNWVRG